MSRVDMGAVWAWVAGLVAGCAVLMLGEPAVAQTGVSSAITYQGELRSGQDLVNGAKDLKFRLYDAQEGGNPVGPELLAAGLAIEGGRFTVELNFGAEAFQGQARWLQISVAEPGSNVYVVLTPRQSVTAAPYALYALNAPEPEERITASVDAQFSVDDRSGWAHVENLADDTCHFNIPLGFTFTGWGRSVTTVSVSSNGVLFFGSGCSVEWINGSLPSAITGDPMLAFFWDDLMDYGGSEYFQYATFGTAPGRVFNLFFRMRPRNVCAATEFVQVMVSVHEGSNLIRATYSGLTGCAQIRGSSATFGLQGPGGAAADAFLVSVNAPILDDNAPRQSLSFQPPRR